MELNVKFKLNHNKELFELARKLVKGDPLKATDSKKMLKMFDMLPKYQSKIMVAMIKAMAKELNKNPLMARFVMPSILANFPATLYSAVEGFPDEVKLTKEERTLISKNLFKISQDIKPADVSYIG